MRRVPLIGASLAFNNLRVAGAARGYPYEPEALTRIADSPLRRPFGLLPGWARDRIIRSVRREISVAAALLPRPLARRSCTSAAVKPAAGVGAMGSAAAVTVAAIEER